MKTLASRILATSIATAAVSSPGWGANIFKANNSDSLESGTSWTGGLAPTSSGTAYFDATAVTTLAYRTMELGADVIWGTIRVDGGTGAFAINSATDKTITLNGTTDASSRLDSILLNSSSGPSLTIGANLALGANNTYFTSSRSLTINGDINLGSNTLKLFPAGSTSLIEMNGIISGSAAANANAMFADQNGGNGTIRLTNSSNSFTGRIELGSSASGMRLEFTSAGALGNSSEIRFRNTGGTAGSGSILRYTGTTATTLTQTIQCDTSIGMRIESTSVGGSLTLNGAFSQTNRPLYLGGTGTGANTLATAFAGSGALTKRDGGKWILIASNTNSGNTTVSGGTLAISSGGGIYRGGFNGGAVVSVGSGATLELQNWNYNVSTASLGGLGNTAGRIAINGGTIRMTGTTAYGRGVTVDAGGATFEAATGTTWTFDDTGDGNVAFVYNSNPSLTFAGEGSFVFNKAFSGTGSLTKSNSGTLTLAAASSYTGESLINNGTLLVNANNGSATGAVTVAAGATLGGTGSLGGAVTVSGSVAPGTTGIGMLTVNNDVTWNSGNSWKFNLNNTNNTSDKLELTGSFTKGTGGNGDFVFDFLGATPAWNTTYTLVTFGSSSGFAAGIGGNFSYTGLGTGPYGTSYFTLTGNSLTFTAIPEISNVMVVALSGAATLRRRRKTR